MPAPARAPGRSRPRSGRRRSRMRPGGRPVLSRRCRGGRGAGWLRPGYGTAVIAVLVVLAVGYGISRLDFGDTLTELTLPLRHDDIIRQQAREKDVPADLIAAVIYAESRFRDQTSDAGARGLMQITPDTADTIEKLSGGETFVSDDLADPDLNIRYGTFFLRHLLDRYDGNELAALAGYNAGMTNADAWGGAEIRPDDIEFPETLSYVEDVLERREQYREKYGSELGF